MIPETDTAPRSTLLALKRTTRDAAIEETFAQHIANGHTVTSAFKAMGMSARSPTAWALAKSATVTKRVQDLVAQKLAAAGVTAERTKREIARVAYADVRKIFNEDGQLLPIHEIDDDTAAAITSITVSRRNIGTMKEPEYVDVMKIKFASKMDALGLLAKHFKLVNDEGDGVNALANALADRLGRAKVRAPLPPVEEVEDAVEAAPRRPVIVGEPAVEGGVLSAAELLAMGEAFFDAPAEEAAEDEQLF